MGKRIQYGAASFREILETGSLYLDKTARIYELITKGSRRFFLSRPRRFGKTLLISTLSEIFQGNKELFQGLSIYNTDYDWKAYPVIRLSLSTFTARDANNLNRELIRLVKGISKKLKCKISWEDSVTARDYFCDLFEYFSNQDQQVVVLIDEYDYPILKNVDLDTSSLEEIRETLKDFYSVLKGNTDSIRFLFLTGVGSFSKTSIFSGINDLSDISADERYADLLGYTQEELEHYFAPYIDEGSKKLGLTRSDFIEKIKTWYDGYRFSRKDLNVYNPSSINKFFESESYNFDSFWISTGTSEFLIKLLSKPEYSDFDLQKKLETGFINFLQNNILTIYNIDPIVLLYQSGYLTIKDYDSQNSSYKLGFPNLEVKEAFISYLSEILLSTTAINLSTYEKVAQSLVNNDPDAFIEEISKFFTTISTNPQPYRENAFMVGMLALLYISKNLWVDSETPTHLGRADITVRNHDTVYVIEIKVDKEKGAALKQIEDKEYIKKFTSYHKYDSYSVVAIGINFNSKTRQIIDAGYKTIR